MPNRNGLGESDKSVRNGDTAPRSEARLFRRPGVISSGGPTLKKQLRYDLRRRNGFQP